MDNELKTIRRELKLREDQLRQLERETQVSVTLVCIIHAQVSTKSR